MAEKTFPPLSFDTHPSRYIHWQLQVSPENKAVATLTMKVQEDRPLWENAYELKLNSYDMSVDIELNDAVTRLRLEHPEVRAIVVTGGYDKVFCAGANIRMLAQASHAFKVNFCKFTNETRCGIEEACAAGQTYIAALNGTASGGGYELAMACQEIYLIDDGNAAVSLPEVPLLGVLPGTGGLTRLTDKRKVRRDMADVFCTKAEGFKARDAVKYRFVDGAFTRSKWQAQVTAKAAAVAAKAGARNVSGVQVPALERNISDTDISYRYVSVKLNVEERTAEVLVRGPDAAPEASVNTWSLRMFRELEDALLRLRFNFLDIGVLVLKSEGSGEEVLKHDAVLQAGFDGSEQSQWLAGEIRAWQSRVLKRVDNMAKSWFAVIEPGSCFAGVLLELVLASDRSFLLAEGDNGLWVGPANAGLYPMASGMTRLQARFPGQPERVGEILERQGECLDAESIEELELVTSCPDEIDWADEVRIAIEERASMSPDALTGMEQNLRFGGPEVAENKIYGRLTAWQNWIFQRPNAVGTQGALKLFGAPERPVFDYKRT